MQGIRRKITKKELKEDKLITTYYKTRAYLDKHGKSVAFAAVAVVVIGVIIGLVINSKIQSNYSAGYEVYKAQSLIDRGEFSGAISVVNQLIDTFPGTGNAAEALVVLARTHFKLGNYDSTAYYAGRYVDKYSGRNAVLTCTALALQAATLEEKSEFLRAGELYLQAAHDYPDLYIAPVYLIEAGRCFNQAGADDHAIEAYEEVIRKYGEYEDLASRANEQIARAGGYWEELPIRIKLF